MKIVGKANVEGRGSKEEKEVEDCGVVNGLDMLLCTAIGDVSISRSESHIHFIECVECASNGSNRADQEDYI